MGKGTTDRRPIAGSVQMTKHAHIRMQQRGIPPLIGLWLDEFGEEEYDGHGGVRRYFTRKSIRAMERAFGRRPVSRMAECRVDVAGVIEWESNGVRQDQRRRQTDPGTAYLEGYSSEGAITLANTACNYLLLDSCSGCHSDVAGSIEQETLGT